MSIFVTATANMSADEADPQISRCATSLTAGRVAAVYTIAANGARRVTPLLQAFTVELVIAHLHTKAGLDHN